MKTWISFIPQILLYFTYYFVLVTLNKPNLLHFALLI